MTTSITKDQIFSSDATWTHRRNGIVNKKPMTGTEVAEIFSGQEIKNTKRELIFKIGNNGYSFNFYVNNIPYGDDAPELENTGD